MAKSATFAGMTSNTNVKWLNDGPEGSETYYLIYEPKSYVEAAKNLSRVIGGRLPHTEESVIPISNKEQIKEKTYHHEGDHHNEPNTRKKKETYCKKCQKGKNKKNGHIKRSPEDLKYGGYDKSEYYNYTEEIPKHEKEKEKYNTFNNIDYDKLREGEIKFMEEYEEAYDIWCQNRNVDRENDHEDYEDNYEDNYEDDYDIYENKCNHNIYIDYEDEAHVDNYFHDPPRDYEQNDLIDEFETLHNDDSCLYYYPSDKYE